MSDSADSRERHEEWEQDRAPVETECLCHLSPTTYLSCHVEGHSTDPDLTLEQINEHKRHVPWELRDGAVWAVEVPDPAVHSALVCVLPGEDALMRQIAEEHNAALERRKP